MLEALKNPEKRIVGAKQVQRAIAAGKLSHAFIARDADPFVTKPVMDLAEKHGVKLIEVDTMQSLGLSCAIDVKASVAGLYRE